MFDDEDSCFEKIISYILSSMFFIIMLELLIFLFKEIVK